jgi:hypothetical protein
MRSEDLSEPATPETNCVRLVVDQHYQYRRDSPEEFDWQQVINPKVASLARTIADEVTDRRNEWPLTGRRGDDPCIPGLQEALRVIARSAVWSVQSEQKIRSNEAARLGYHNARHLPGSSGTGVHELPVSAVGSL